MTIPFIPTPKAVPSLTHDHAVIIIDKAGCRMYAQADYSKGEAKIVPSLTAAFYSEEHARDICVSLQRQNVVVELWRGAQLEIERRI